MQSFTEYYYYDEVGNMLELDHQAGHSASFTRDFTIDTASNRMTSSVADSVTENYSYDSRGNLITGMNHLVSMAYNDDSRLQIVAITSTLTAYYQYDRNGQRTRKTIKDTSAGTTKVRRYVGNYELYTEQTGSTVTLKRETLHVNDEAGRVCLIDTKRNPSTGAVIDQLIRYQYSDHLNTAMLELDDAAAIISYEEYHPFGSTSYQAGRTTTEVSLKRYRYTAKERDEETGLYYHGARYYAPWLCRWCAVDPKESQYSPQSSYIYCSDNPVMRTDEDGMGDKDKTKMVTIGAEASVTRDSDGKLVSASLTTYSVPEEAISNGEYEINSETPARAVITDGELRVSNMPADPAAASSNKGSILGNGWEAYKAVDPVTAGVMTGTYNFTKSTIEGAVNMIAHPIQTLEGIGLTAYSLSDFGRYSPIGLEYNARMAQAIDATINKFKNGDAYTRTSMGTEAGLTLASMFVGGGEARGAKVLGEIPWSSKTLAQTAKELKAGALDVTVKTQSEAEELFLGIYQGKGYRNTTEMTTLDMKDKYLFPEGKSGTYHWDLNDTQHGGISHLQIHPFYGKGIIRIFF